MVEGYKQTDVGLIPVDWEVKNLETIGAFKKGKGIKKDEVVTNGLPCIRYGELYTHHNEYIKTFNSHINSETAKKSQIINKNDILFAGSGETKEEIGKCAVLIDDIKAFAGGDVIILTPRKSNSLFLGFLLNSQKIAKQKAQQAQGDAVVHIYPSNLASIKIPLPPLKEQEAIAEVLFDTDLLIIALGKRIAKKRLIKQGTIQKLLMPKDDWEVKKLGEVFLFSATSSKKKYFTLSGKYIVMDMGSVSTNGKIIKGKKANCNFDILSVGELVMPKDDIGGGNIIGKVAYIDKNDSYILSDHVYKLSKKVKYIDTLFFSYLINGYAINNELRKKSSGSAQLGLGKKLVENQQIQFPLYDEQNHIATILSDMDSEIDVLEKKLAKIKELKQGLIQQLLTGKIRLA